MLKTPPQYHLGARMPVFHLLSVLTCFLAFAANASAVPTSANAALLGDWEVTRVLMTKGMQPQWSMREDDPRLMGRVLRIEPQSLWFRGADSDCALGPVLSSKIQSMTTLFAKSAEKGGGKRAAGMEGYLYGHISHYELGALRAQPVTIREIRCAGKDTKLLAEANWLAKTAAKSGSSSAILMAYQPDALLVLRRVPSADASADAARVVFCSNAESASEKAICADRQLWIMHGYTESAAKRARSSRADVNAAIDSDIALQLQKRQTCSGNTSCLYEVLDRHIELLVQRW